MNLKTAESLLPCCRGGEAGERKVEKALRKAEGDVYLREQVRQQAEWDQKILRVLASIHAPEGLRRKLHIVEPAATTPVKKGFLRRLLHPAALSVALGVAVLLGILIFFEVERREHFAGREATAGMIELTNSMSGVEFEPVDTQVGKLGDWFYMRRFEGFAVPPEIAPLPVAGARVYRQKGHQVAQMAVETNHSIAFVFRRADFGVGLLDDNKWHYFDHEGWAAAVRVQGQMCTMLAFRGNVRQMRDFVHGLQKDLEKTAKKS